jgi:Metallo-beta-lactamase superfamily
MASADPIRRVSVLSTGTVAIHPEQVAVTWKPTYLWLFTSRRWTQPLPVNAYVIEHRDGLVLFDTGQGSSRPSGQRDRRAGPGEQGRRVKVVSTG